MDMLRKNEPWDRTRELQSRDSHRPGTAGPSPGEPRDSTGLSVTLRYDLFNFTHFFSKSVLVS